VTDAALLQMAQSLLALGAPALAAKALSLAVQALDEGEIETARQIALQAGQANASLASQAAEILNAAGQALDDASQAAEAFRDAASFQPMNPHYFSNLGDALRRLGRLEEAKSALGQALALAPGMAELHNNLAVLFIAMGLVDEAGAELAQALALKPGHPPSLANLGTLRQLEGKFAEAAHAFRASLELDPANLGTRIDLAEALKDLGHPDQALAELEPAFSAPSPELLVTWGNILKTMGRHEEASAAYGRSLSIEADPAVAIKHALLMPVIPASAEAIHNERRRMESEIARLDAQAIRLTDPERRVGTTSFHLAYHHLDDRPLQEATARLYRKACPELSWTAPHCHGGNWKPGKRLKVGFVSRHLHAHTMAKLNRGLIADLDRQRFEVFLFQTGQEDEISREIAATADHARRLNGPLAGLRDAIAQAELDILYFPDIGMEPTTYFLAFARLAPVQILACGHPDTSGLETLDYAISSADLDPPGNEAFYTEKLARLEGFPFYMRRPPSRNMRMSRAELGLPEAARLYLCPQSLFKFHPDFDPVLADILTLDPQGKLVLIEQMHPEITQRLLARIAKVFPAIRERTILLPRQDPQRFFALLKQADALLDPIYFSGGSSSLEAFAAGQPVVTMPGTFLRERVTYGAYRKLGLLECVAQTPQDYARIAHRLANDPAWKEEIASDLADAAPALFLDKAELTRLENFLEDSVANSPARSR
jgi:protein O-GlcNAc transferase